MKGFTAVLRKGAVNGFWAGVTVSAVLAVCWLAALLLTALAGGGMADGGWLAEAVKVPVDGGLKDALPPLTC